MAKGKKNKAKYTPKTEPVNAQQSSSSSVSAPLTFGKQNYILMLIGFVIIVVGLLLMTGGAMPDPNTWDESVIYSARRITLAPIVILIGLGVEIYAIFK